MRCIRRSNARVTFSQRRATKISRPLSKTAATKGEPCPLRCSRILRSMQVLKPM
jgi:hypothetical protein